MFETCSNLSTIKKAAIGIALFVSVSLAVGVLVFFFVERSSRYVTHPETHHRSRSLDYYIDKPLSELKPHPYHYFPAILDVRVSFDRALAECEWHRGYTSAGLATANKRFLDTTVHMFKDFTGAGVWVGGFFDLSSRYPHHVQWTDGKVSDSKESPSDIWCQDPVTVISELKSKNLTKSVVPIVRLTNATCLTIYTNDALTNDTTKKFAPLCVTQDAKMSDNFEENIVLESFKDLFDTEKGGMFNVADELDCNDCQLDEKYPVRFSKGALLNHYGVFIVGFKQLVDYRYASLICKSLRRRDKSDTGHLFGYRLLRDDSNATADDLRRSMADSNARLANFTKDLHMTTAGYFDFDPKAVGTNASRLMWADVAASGASEAQLLKMASDYCNGNDTSRLNGELLRSEYVQLAMNCKEEYWNEFKAKLWDATVAFGWCSTSPNETLKIVRAIHDKFSRWYNDEGGHLTSGPFRVYVVVELRNGQPCLEVVADDLYWPGAHSFVPVCEANLANKAFERFV